VTLAHSPGFQYRNTCNFEKLTAVVRLQPKGADSIKAIGRARRGGVEVDGHDKLMNFGAFEAHAGSSLRRATGNMYAMNGRIVQVGAGHTGTPRPLIGACGAVVGVAKPAACQMAASKLDAGMHIYPHNGLRHVIMGCRT